MSNILKTACFLFIALFIIASCARKKSATQAEQIEWMSYEEAVEASKRKPKKIFVDVYTSWCGWCKAMDKKVLTDPQIVSDINEHYYAVKLNAESTKKVIYKGKTMTEQQLAQKVFNATGYPTTVYLDSKENVISPVPGYLEADVLHQVLLFFGEDHYKNTTFEKYQSQFELE
ncbi:DUF255 domain-containing protein [Cytophagaceae bacterium ABcell3]|nr:DUF255 domain-containing protein [Cytophagaceae bacterium ABcell3]